MWNDAVGYETYVGHWSRAVAPRFLDWLMLPTRLRWLDVACGTGALTSAILGFCDPEEVVGLDASADYLAAAQRSCQEPRVRFVVGDANVLSFPSTSFDVSVSGLALNFIFWDAALSIDPRAAAYDPGRKATICREQNLHEALVAAGCTGVETCVFDDSGEFPSREAYWHAFDGRQGSTSDYLSLLTDEEHHRLQASLLSTMNPHGPVNLKIRALAVKGLHK